MRLRSASRWRCGGVETDAAQNGPGSSLPQSPPEAAATGPPPECSERGSGRVRAPLPSAGQGRAWGGRMEHPERPAAGLQPRCASTLRGPRCVGPFSPRLSIIQPPPRPYSFLLPPPQTHPARQHARPSPPHSSTPLCRALLTTVLLQPLPPRTPRLPGPRPSPQTGGEGRRDNPPALRSRAPSRVGVAWLRPGPQRLTSCLPTPWSVPQFSTRLSFPYEGTREQAWCPRSRRHPGRRELERSPGLQDSGLGETPSRPPTPHTVGEGEKGFWPGPLFAWFSPGTGFLPHPRCAVL